jgi:hypothetical protein
LKASVKTGLFTVAQALMAVVLTTCTGLIGRVFIKSLEASKN